MTTDSPNPLAVELVDLVRQALWRRGVDAATLEVRYHRDGGVWIGFPGLTAVHNHSTVSGEALPGADLQALASSIATDMAKMSTPSEAKGT